MDRHVLNICIAYEQGVGKGRSNRCKQKDNPYPDKSEEYNGYEYQAWDYGWQEGNNWLTQRAENLLKE